MAKQTINIGTSANKGDGDPLRTAFSKINQNFDELYAGGFADPNSTGSSIIPDVDATYDLGSATKQWADLHVADFIYLNGARLEITSTGALLINGGAPAEVQDVQGSVFGDDSTTLVDAVNNVINLNGTISGNVIPDADVAYDLGSATNRFRDLYLSGSSIDLGGTVLSVAGGALQIGGTSIADVARAAVADGSTGFNYSEVDGTSEIGVTADIFDFGDGKTIDMQNSTILFTGSTITGLEVQATGDLTGSVFADDSTLLVDSVNGKIVGPIDTATITASALNLNISARNYVYVDSNEGGSIVIGQGANSGSVVVGKASGIFTVNSDAYFNSDIITNSIASPATGNLELDVGRESGGAFIVTAWEDKNDAENGWKQILWSYDTNRYSFFVGGDVDTQGSVNVSQNLNVTNNINVSSSGVITTSATDKGLVVEGPLTANMIPADPETPESFNTVSNGVNIRTYRIGDDLARDWTYSWDGTLYPPYDANSTQVGAIEWRTPSFFGQLKSTPAFESQPASLKLTTYNSSDIDGAIIIEPGNAQWTFNKDGSLSLPGAVILPTEGLTDGSPASPTALSLDKQVQILSGAANEGFYSLADGLQGQIMYFTPVNSGVYVIVENARIRNTSTGAVEIVTDYSWQVDFDPANEGPRTIAMAIFVDGAWNLTGGATD